MKGLIKSTKSGTRLTEKGMTILSGLVSSIPAETSIPKSSVAVGKFNYVVLLKQYGFAAIRSGIEQRDAAIKMGASGATTLLFKENKFVIPGTNYNSLTKEPRIAKLLIEKLNPEDGDVIIIGSALEDIRTAELAAKNAALLTIVNHDEHAQ
jgi:phosphoglycolate phosphatase-like HAD superfamily hydrolase